MQQGSWAVAADFALLATRCLFMLPLLKCM